MSSRHNIIFFKMSDDSGLGEDIILLCLRTVDEDKMNIQQLESVGINVYVYDDVDEYIQYMVSINSDDVFVFAWLGSGWNHLVAILDDFEQVHCIYLSEPSTDKYVPKVHGVFTDTTELFQQVLVDARTCQLNQSTHLNVFDNQETSTIQNRHGKAVRSMWSQILMQTFLRMPTPATDVYREMLDEARHFYRNNPVQMAQIDYFEKNYQTDKAIDWYSRDSFAYRLVNKALRTQNLVLIFKFRHFIRDVYEQLTKLHSKQNLNLQTKSGKCSINTKVFCKIL